MRSSTETLIEALHILARDIESNDGVANATIAEAANRLQEYHSLLQSIERMTRGAIDEKPGNLGSSN